MSGARKPARFYAHHSDVLKRDLMEDRRKPAFQATSRSRYVHDDQAGTKTSNWLIDLKTLAHHLATTPEAIRMLASKEQHLKWSFTTDQGWCIHKRDLPAWKFASRNAGRHE